MKTITRDVLKNYVIGYTDWLKSHERFKEHPALSVRIKPAYPITELELIREWAGET